MSPWIVFLLAFGSDCANASKPVITMSSVEKTSARFRRRSQARTFMMNPLRQVDAAKKVYREPRRVSRLRSPKSEKGDSRAAPFNYQLFSFRTGTSDQTE